MSAKIELDKVCPANNHDSSRFLSWLSVLIFVILFTGRGLILYKSTKTGAFLKELRKQTGLTQEQLAEKFSVSNRTVSRWENGNNLPDLDILIALADYYEVDLRALLDGERKSGKMNCDMEETVCKAVEYTSVETERYAKRIHLLLLAGTVCWFISSLMNHTALSQHAVLSVISDFLDGVAIGMILCSIIFTSRYSHKIKAFKQRLFQRK